MDDVRKVQVKVTEHMEWFVDVNVPSDLTDELDIIEYIQKEEDWVYDDMIQKGADRDIWAEVTKS
jgi:hypothetical protein